MVFDNGSQIVLMLSVSDFVCGESAIFIVVDEWVFLLNVEEVWVSIEFVADVGGCIVGLFMANGLGNFFHYLWTGSMMGNNKFSLMFFLWSVMEDSDEVWYESKWDSMLLWQLV